MKARAEEAEGRIVVYNVPFPEDVPAYEGYSQNVDYRVNGAVEAAKVGAVASLIRSITPYSMQTPHTGSMYYEPGVRRIPHGALTVEDAMLLQRLQDRGERMVIRLEMEAHMLPDAVSHNVVGELVGAERPDEIVVIGCHIDSWDVGDGSMDDAGACVVTWEAVRLMQKLGLRPRRTVRVVFWTNEENGFRGREAYARAHEDEFDNYVMALELDIGVFQPEGFGFSGTAEALDTIREIGLLLGPTGVSEIYDGGGGPDILPLMQAGVPSMSFHTDYSRYLWYHHSAADTLDKLDPREVALSVAAVAVMTYVVADMPERLPR